MSWKIYYSLDRLINEAKRLADRSQTISFDLFDTLLIRRIHDPDLVKLPVARYIASLAQTRGIKKSWQTVQKLRDQIEQRQRQETGETFDDHEASYPVFMKSLLQKLFKEHYRDNLLDVVTSYELKMESSMLVPRRQLAEWLAELHQRGKQILIISDVYLPSEHLKILIDKAGLLSFVDEIISSADTFLAKASGKAFPLIEKRFALDKSSWMHIGDNPISDGVRASEFGLRALVLRDAREKHRKSIIKRYYNYGMGRPFYRGRALQQLMLSYEGENIEQSDLYVEGYNFIGPMVGAFVQHIAEECRRLGLSKIFFLSREGYTFKKVWEKCTPLLYPDANLPEIEYLYVSRMALAGANCAVDGLTQTSVSIAFLPAGNRDFRDIARIFKLDLEKVIPYLSRYKLTQDSCLSPLHEGYEQKYSIRLLELLEDESFQEEVRRQTLPANEALSRYLEDVSFFTHDQVAIVDIGWLGTIQRFLYNSVKHRQDCPRLHGFLFGATRGIAFPDDLKNDIQGVVYDRNRFDLSASCILYARDVFEEACRAPYPTLDGYELSEDGYKLKFRDTTDSVGRAEEIQDDYFAPLQQGIIDSAERFGAASALLGYSLADYRPWLNYLIVAKLAFPKSSEIATIRHKHHLDDFHGTHIPSKTKTIKQLWDSRLTNLRLNPLLRLRYFWRHVRSVIKS